MRLLHTGDWHVGKTLARLSRINESREILGEVAEIATSEEVDVVVVAGDVFDYLSPSAAAEATVYDALIDFVRRQIPVVLIAGNHDHAHRWRALEPLLDRFAGHVLPEPPPPYNSGILDL